MSNKVYSQLIINNWISALNTVNTEAIKIFKILGKEEINIRDGTIFVKLRDGSIQSVEGLGGAINRASLFLKYEEDTVYRQGLVSEQTKFNSIAIKSRSIARKLEALPLVKGYKSLPLIITNNIENLMSKIDLITQVTGLIDCVDAQGALIQVDGGTAFGEIDLFALLDVFKAPVYVFLRDEIPDYGGGLGNIKSSLDTINTDQTADLPEEDFPSTGINLNEKDTRDLIDAVNTTNETSDSGAIVANENAEINSESLSKVLDLLLQILAFCQSINTDTDNIIFNMNVRFRNITLPDDQDDVYNLSTWLFAFQKQVMNTLFDAGELLNVINKNQIKTDEKIVAIQEEVRILEDNQRLIQNNIQGLSQNIAGLSTRLSAIEATQISQNQQLALIQSNIITILTYLQ